MHAVHLLIFSEITVFPNRSLGPDSSYHSTHLPLPIQCFLVSGWLASVLLVQLFCATVSNSQIFICIVRNFVFYG
jgi:hypothetical protein